MRPTEPEAAEVVEVAAVVAPPRRGVLRQAAPFVVGAAMFALAAWVLHGTLARHSLDDLRRELASLTAGQVGLAVLFAALSFAALVGYEHSSLRLIGRRVPFPDLALASFVTQSIAHSTGFAFFAGATLRYQFYAGRGLSIVDVAKIQIIFTATFTLGVATLAGGVLLVAPERLAAATGLPGWAWRLGGLAGLGLVCAYVAWGAFLHKPFILRGRVFALPATRSTLTQIFFGVADLAAVAAALHVLLPPELGLSYVEVLAVFMACIVVGLVSHVPGSLGVFESGVLLLVQPTEAQTLPLVGALLAFRACYYVLPLVCGVLLLAAYELVRWRRALGRSFAGLWERARPLAPTAAAGLTALAGALLLLATVTPVPEARAERLAAALPRAVLGTGKLASSALGIGLLALSRGIALRVAHAWGWGVLMLAAGTAVCLATAEPPVVWVPLVLTVALLVVSRREFARPPPSLADWMTPGWVALCAAGAVLAAFVLSRG